MPRLIPLLTFKGTLLLLRAGVIDKIKKYREIKIKKLFIGFIISFKIVKFVIHLTPLINIDLSYG